MKKEQEKTTTMQLTMDKESFKAIETMNKNLEQIQELLKLNFESLVKVLHGSLKFV